MRLRKLSGLVFCLMVLFVVGCGSGSDSTAGNGTGNGGIDAPGNNGDTDDPDLGDMACWIGTVPADLDDRIGGVPEMEATTHDSDSMNVAAGEPNLISADDDASTTNPGDDVTPTPIEGMVRIAEMYENVTDLETDAYEIAIVGDAAPVIMGDTMTVTLSRGGGCPDEEHDFTLVAGHEFWPGEPIELDFTIVHDNMGDRCEGYPTDPVEFDLTEIKDLYEAEYPTGDGVVFLVFKAPDGSACNAAGLRYDLGMTATSP